MKLEVSLRASTGRPSGSPGRASRPRSAVRGRSSMSNKTVLLVDDDRIFAKALGRTLENAGYVSLLSHDTHGALLLARENKVDCAIIDYNLGAMLGTTLMTRLRDAGFDFPVIVLTGFGDVPTATTAIKLGAAEFLEKPHNPEKLTAAIEGAVAEWRERSGSSESIREARQKLRVLTPRESEIVDAIVAGRTTRQIAEVLGVSQRTVDAHRAAILNKLEISNTAELIRLAIFASLTRPHN